jgi:flagellar biogenesis protein FliO
LSPVASYVVQSLVTLLGVAALAVLLLYGARRTGIGRASGPIELVGRLPLDGRRAVYLVRVESTLYMLGSSEAGLTKLGEMPAPGSPPLVVREKGEAPS